MLCKELPPALTFHTAGVATLRRQGRQGSSSIAMVTVDESSPGVFLMFIVVVHFCPDFSIVSPDFIKYVDKIYEI